VKSSGLQFGFSSGTRPIVFPDPPPPPSAPQFQLPGDTFGTGILVDGVGPIYLPPAELPGQTVPVPVRSGTLADSLAAGLALAKSRPPAFLPLSTPKLETPAAPGWGLALLAVASLAGLWLWTSK
jgi:hypothetical protein